MESHHNGTYASLTLLAVLVAATLWLWREAEKVGQDKAAQRFEHHSSEATYAIQQRLLSYEQVLLAGAGLFDASQEVTRAEWRQFVRRLNFPEKAPGIQGLGFAKVVEREQIPAFEQAVRAQGYPDFALWPDGERALYTSIVYLEPEDWRNLRALGYDMFSEPVRRAAMSRARDTGEASASRSVLLVQEDGTDKQAGFLLYLPLYIGSPAVPEDVETRRMALRGFVYSPFRIKDLMHGILGQPAQLQSRLQVYDWPEADPDALIYDSQANNPRVDTVHSRFSANIPLQFNGQHWTLRYSSLPAFEQSAPLAAARWLLWGGLLFSVLLSTLVWLLWRGQQRRYALLQAREHLHSESLQRAQVSAELRQFFAMSPDILCTLDAQLRIQRVNGTGEKILGAPAQALRGCTFLSRVSPEDQTEIQVAAEYLLNGVVDSVQVDARHPDPEGDIFWVNWNLVRVEDVDGFYGYGRDITERKMIEQALHHHAFHDKLTGVANRALFIDRLEQLMYRRLQEDGRYAVMIMDIDNFKGINDTYGHLVGDQLLQAFVARVQAVLRPSDTLARFGGDEFTLLMEDLPEPQAASRVAERILAALSSPVILQEQEYRLGSSIGIALGGAQSRNPDELLRQADQALYQAKREGKHRYCLYRETIAMASQPES